MEEKFSVRKGTRLSEYSYSTPGYYFVTICTLRRQPFFAGADIELTRIGKIAAQCLVEMQHHQSGVSVDMFCVMPDHIHAIIVIDPVGAAYMPPDRTKELLIKVIQQYKAA